MCNTVLSLYTYNYKDFDHYSDIGHVPTSIISRTFSFIYERPWNTLSDFLSITGRKEIKISGELIAVLREHQNIFILTTVLLLTHIFIVKKKSRRKVNWPTTSYKKSVFFSLITRTCFSFTCFGSWDVLNLTKKIQCKGKSYIRGIFKEVSYTDMEFRSLHMFLNIITSINVLNF